MKSLHFSSPPAGTIARCALILSLKIASRTSGFPRQPDAPPPAGKLWFRHGGDKGSCVREPPKQALPVGERGE